ncbi:hypothetical protein [Leucobacter sp. PH1c]|uniref:hypothetical protein n=1 Tax=Leucobacter sp. PH1c TaxID=1397278 RepID=UPI00046A02A0|nr:hypothetical protein [Leucobacter sp. PH1c]
MTTTAILPGTAPTTVDAAADQTIVIPAGEAALAAATDAAPQTGGAPQFGAAPQAGAEQAPFSGGYAPGAPTGAPGSPAGSVPASSAPAEEGDNGRVFAIVGFVLGIASIVSSWTFIAPIAGLVFSILALRRRTTERTLALWGVWLNGIMLGFTALGILIGIIALGFGLIVLPFAWF